MKRLIKNGTLLLSEGLVKKDLLFDEDQILKIEEEIQEDCEVIDASGLTVIPGLVDVHVHLREPGYTQKETIHTGTQAAAHGGFTTIFCMPNVIPYPDDIETLKDYTKKLHQDAVVNVYPYACITKEEASKEVVDMKEIKEHFGIRWFSDDGVGVSTSQVMEEAMKTAKENDCMIVAHTEDMAYRKPGACVHESPVNTEKGWLGIPSACESAQLIRDLKLTESIGNAYHACHISAKESVEALSKAKTQGANVSAEVTAHHLLLEDKDVQGPNWKMNPPLRSHEDRMALIEGLESGALDLIANDHAPHTEKEKAASMDKAPFGIVSLETSFPLLYTEFVHRQKRWTLAQLVNWMSTVPARRFGLEKIGALKEGYHADLVLVDLEHESVIDKDAFLSKGKNTPFDGWKVYGSIRETIVHGKTVWKG